MLDPRISALEEDLDEVESSEEEDEEEEKVQTCSGGAAELEVGVETHNLRLTRAAGAPDGGLINETGSGVGVRLVEGFFFFHSQKDSRPPNHTGAVTVTTTDLGAPHRLATGEVVPPDGLFLSPFSVALSCCRC